MMSLVVALFPSEWISFLESSTECLRAIIADLILHTVSWLGLCSTPMIDNLTCTNKSIILFCPHDIGDCDQCKI